MIEGLSNIDLAIIIGYMVLVLIIGVAVGMQTKTGEDLFLGGRTLTWGVIGFSLFASNISSTTLIGLSGAAYSTGISSSNYEWLAGLPLILMAAVFIPIYLRARLTTIPEYLELRFDLRSRKLFSAITIFVSVSVEMAGGLYAGAVVLQTFMPQLDIWSTALALALFAGAYTAFGGLKAVVYTDALQAIILIAGCSMLTYILFAELDFSWSAVVDATPEGHLSVIKPMDDPTLPWLGTLVGVPLLGFWYWATNQYVTQRVLAAKNIDHARKGAMFGGFLKLLPVFIMVLPGAMAISVIPNIPNSDMVFPTLVSQVLPVGVVGLVMAGLISAILSTVDSTLNSASTLIVVDFIKPSKPDISPQKVARYGRITTIIIMAISSAWAPFIADFGGLWLYLQQMFSVIVPPIVVLFLGGVFYPKAGGLAGFITLVSGLVLGVAVVILRQFDLFELHFTITVGLMIVICSLIFVLCGRFIAEQPKDITQLIYQPGMTQPAPSTRWWQDYRVHSGVLLVCMAAILVVFW